MTEGVRIVFGCPVSPWLIGAAAAVLLVLVAVILVRDVRQLKRAPRLAVLALSLGSGVLLTAMLLNPTMIRQWQDRQKPRCVLLVDGSRSMLLSDTLPEETVRWLTRSGGRTEQPAGAQVTREDVARSLLAPGPQGLVGRLEKAFTLTGLRFASSIEHVPLGQGAPVFQVDKDGYCTALGDALEQASGAEGGERPRAIIVVSDGAWNKGKAPEEVARVLGGLGVPVFTLGVGNPEPPRDVAVTGLRAPKKVLLGDEVFLTAQIVAAGVGSAPLTTELLCAANVVAGKQTFAPPSGREVSVGFSHIPQEPGRHVFTVRIPAQQGEKDTSNNSASAVVEVVESKIGVLMVEAEPRWEFRFIRNVFERDPAIEVKVCLLRPGVGPVGGENYVAALPADAKGLAPFDVVLLGDVARDKLPDEFLSSVAAMVKERSGALIVIAGRHCHYRDLAGTPVGEVLPVELSGPGVVYAKTTTPFEVELAPDGTEHLITRLAQSAEENEAIWSGFPQMTWSATVSGLRRGATALLVHPYRLAGARKLPLLAVQRAGSGKVMFCGIEETWRWRRSVGDRYHYRFWAQAVRWMAKKQFTEGDTRARLSLDRTDCDTGETVEVQAYCLGPDGFPLDKARVCVQVSREGGQTHRIALDAAAGGWGMYGANFTPNEPGTYRMQPIVSTYGEEPLASVATLEVARVDLEKKFLAQDRSALTAIAQASGGKYIDASKADELPAVLEAQVQRRVLTAEHSPLRHWGAYVVLAMALGAAWFIRKRSGLA